jgi:putative Mg2+ transporter-C (MgtC) family protein
MTLHEFATNIFVALALGLAIGLERQWRQHTAGLRTNALVALGSALFVSLSVMIDHENSPTRIAGQVASGLGFLGGGVILREGLNVRGLNTAATIWCSGAVGTLAGTGFLAAAAIGTTAILIVHLALRPVAQSIEARRKTAIDVEMFYRLRVECSAADDARLRTLLLRHIGGHAPLRLQGLATEDSDSTRTIVTADIFAFEQCDRVLEEVVARVSIEPEVRAVSWQKTPA